MLVLFCALLLVIPWPGLGRAYGCLFRSFGNVVFTRFWFWPEARVRFFDLRSPTLVRDVKLQAALGPGAHFDFKPPPATVVLDTLMLLKNEGEGRVATLGFVRTSSRSLGYWPTAFFLALALATPMPWKRKGWALLWGLLLVHGFIAFRLTLVLLQKGFAADKSYALFHPAPFWANLLEHVEKVAVHNPTASFAAAVFIWLVVAFAELSRWLFPKGESDPPSQAGGS